MALIGGVVLAVAIVFAIIAIFPIVINTTIGLLTERVYRLVVRLPLQAPSGGEGIQPVRDLDTIRGYLSGRGPTALFDIPWLPFYLAICFAFHVWIGVTVLVGAIILVALTLLTDMYSKQRTGIHRGRRPACALCGTEPPQCRGDHRARHDGALA